MLAPVHAIAMIFCARAFVSRAGRPRPSRGIGGRAMGPGSVSFTGKWTDDRVAPFVSRSGDSVVRGWAPFRALAPNGLDGQFCSRTSMKSPRLIDKVTANGVLVSRSGQLAHTGGRLRIVTILKPARGSHEFCLMSNTGFPGDGTILKKDSS